MGDEGLVEVFDFPRRTTAPFGGKSPLDHTFGPTSNHVSCSSERNDGQSFLPENEVERVDEVGSGIDQSAVEIKDKGEHVVRPSG